MLSRANGGFQYSLISYVLPIALRSSVGSARIAEIRSNPLCLCVSCGVYNAAPTLCCLGPKIMASKIVWCGPELGISRYLSFSFTYPC